MMEQRTFGQTGVSLSPITFGTMRFYAHRFAGLREAVAFLEYLYDRGINTFHTSSEYETHAFFCETFLKFKQKRSDVKTKHVVKLACPHFEESDFSAARLVYLVDQQLKALNIEQIDVVQWLFRQKKNVDEVRIPKFEGCVEAVTSAFSSLVKAGKVRAFASFPYSLSFANSVSQHDVVSGFADYLNFAERQWVKPLQETRLGDFGFLAIRPLFAGKLLESNIYKETILQRLDTPFNLSGVEERALAYPLLHPSVASIILGFSSQQHADTAIKVGECVPCKGDKEKFFEWSRLLEAISLPEEVCAG
ncbi:MAG: aldo/keto reductase [Legionellaceae bacterium]|nr:aldo/keto reductase [Legionellaceae bacterium]